MNGAAGFCFPPLELEERSDQQGVECAVAGALSVSALSTCGDRSFIPKAGQDQTSFASDQYLETISRYWEGSDQSCLSGCVTKCRRGNGGENSPALQCWVGGWKAGKVPQGTAERCFRPCGTLFPSRRMLPSAKALGYFQTLPHNHPSCHATG